MATKTNGFTAVASDMERVFSPVSHIAREDSPAYSLPPARSWWALRGAKVSGWSLLSLGLAFGLAVLVFSRPAVQPKPHAAADLQSSRSAPPQVPAPKASNGLEAVAVPPRTHNGEVDTSAASIPRQQDVRHKLTTLAPSARPEPKRDKPSLVQMVDVSSTPPTTGFCHDASDPARCLRGEVEGADRRMRQAYNRAVNASLNKAELAKALDAWSAAMSHATQEPAGSIRVIDDLTTRLYNKIEMASLKNTRAK